MKSQITYFTPPAVLPPQTAIVTGQTLVTPAYTLVSSSVLADNVLSFLPGWNDYRCWILCAPAMGHYASFAQYLIYLERGGGSEDPEPEQGVESFLFMLGGRSRLSIAGEAHALAEGGFAFVPPDVTWSIRSDGPEGAKFLWLRKVYEPYGGPPPKPLIGNERDIEPVRRTPTKTITTLIPTNDLAYDFHINIGNLEPGASISTEAHIMEHFEYFLQGKGLYLLNDRWHEVQAGDFIWMRAFCPQAFYPTGPALTRSIFYKNMNRQIMLRNSK